MILWPLLGSGQRSPGPSPGAGRSSLWPVGSHSCLSSPSLGATCSTLLPLWSTSEPDPSRARHAPMADEQGGMGWSYWILFQVTGLANLTMTAQSSGWVGPQLVPLLCRLICPCSHSPVLPRDLRTVFRGHPANAASGEQAFKVCVHQFKMFENIKAGKHLWIASRWSCSLLCLSRARQCAGSSDEPKALPSRAQRSSAPGAQPEPSALGSQHGAFPSLPKASASYGGWGWSFNSWKCQGWGGWGGEGAQLIYPYDLIQQDKWPLGCNLSRQERGVCSSWDSRVGLGYSTKRGCCW